MAIAVACGLTLASSVGMAAENHAADHEHETQSRPVLTDAERAQAKAIFAGQCGWCHGSYGMTADKGPKLAGTKMTKQEVEQRIHNGKPGYMPSFKRFLNDKQIALMAKYIKSLKP